MPRPPRSKVASRVAKPAPQAKTVARKQQSSKTAPKPATIQHSASSISEDSDGLVTKAKTTWPRRRKAWEKTPEPILAADLTMTGALPADDPSERSTEEQTPQTNPQKRRRSMKKGTGSTSQTPNTTTAAAPKDTLRNDLIDIDSSGFDLTFSSLGSESPAHGTRPPSAMKVGATPAHERSVLALTKFKRRARQPSLLRMVHQNTDLEDNDQGDSESDSGEFDDFLPHAESTPLNLRKGQTEDDSRNDSGTHISSSGSRGVKRKLTPVVQVPQSPQPFSPSSGADVESGVTSSPGLPAVLPSREEVVEQTQEDPEIWSETLAPPRSSSPVRDKSTPPPAMKERPRRRGRPAKAQTYVYDSDAEETETPAKAKRAARQKQSISTAQLKNLLPRRRQPYRGRHELDLDTSADVTTFDSDEDELQIPQEQHAQRRAAAKVTSQKATTKSTRGKKAVPSKSKQKATRTYSRRVSSEKENEGADHQDDQTAERSTVEQSERLAAIRRKFAEVDAFELDFETADVTTSSSPFR